VTVETWNDEYYWISSTKLAADARATDAHLLVHSIAKWTGLRLENVRRHNFIAHAYWYDPDEALCARYLQANTPQPCAACPVAQLRGGVSCHSPAPGEARSPWAQYIVGKDPEPMINTMIDTYVHIRK
jgi:hypothetical protein